MSHLGQLRKHPLPQPPAPPGGAALVLMLNALGISNATTVLACNVYFWARLAHYLVYSAGIPWLRTLSFVVSWVCILALLWQLF